MEEPEKHIVDLATMPGKVIVIVPPPMPESELVKHLQGIVADLQKEIYRLKEAAHRSSAAYTRRIINLEELS